ncbi:aldehyde dehydrogenase [Arthrobacter sp. UCD-GKA]|uniref:aldehyde dehydrogenase n=1 Tax=Arthrobacter sp. UCD-GKA TaxID=1913576 RepID=UPI0008DE1650|nr:aldehyde dehydrogenase [Arthrobacter sp. UCD-GKA]OIH85188.1 aldehyde dehydrogenase [Arthrobacter sp. UCD-GKA]
MTITNVQDQITYDSFYVGGEWRKPSNPEIHSVFSASTEQQIGAVPVGSKGDIDAAVAAARRAFDDPQGWSNWTAEQRGEVLQRFAQELDARGEEIARRVTGQNGMPWATSSSIEAVFPGLLVRYYSELALTGTEEYRPGMLGGVTLIRRDPVGVVGAIVPWNVPMALTFMKLAPSLAAGCTVVLKPAPETVLEQYLVAEAAIAAGLPAGVLNIVHGDREVGAHLVSHPDVNKIAFTGSTAAGRIIAAECGRLLRPVSLELGGKSAAIVLDDAKLEDNLEQLFGATMFNSGQTCWLNSRILAPRSRYDEVLEIFESFVGNLVVGDPFDPATQIGPMTSERQRERVEGYIAKGRSEGAKLVAGGGRPSGFERGFYVQPTVFGHVDPHSTIAREEIFGPVLSVIPYGDVEEAIAISNSSEFGLGGSVWTTDQERGKAVARRIESGTIGINHYVNEPNAPFGGIKASGLGRELGPEAMASYQQVKSIYLDPKML